MIVGLALHVLGAVVWVGGMFFAHMVLRPSAGVLDPAVRLPLWNRVLARFFFWVWLAVAALLLTGFGMIALLGGFKGLGIYIHLMMGVGLVMMAIFGHLYFAPWQRFRRAAAREDWNEAEQNIRQIRLLVTVNLILGLVTVVLGASGPYFG
jgi:uncharacterized membrane protein